MVTNCCVKNCKSFWYPNTVVSFHRFPFRNGRLLERWKKIIPLKGHLRKHTSICSDHFNTTDFTVLNTNRILKKDAVPSIFARDAHIKDVLINDSISSELKIENDPVIVSSENSNCISSEAGELKIENEPVIISSEISNPIATYDVPVQTWEPCHNVNYCEEKLNRLQQKLNILQNRLQLQEEKISNLTAEYRVLKKNSLRKERFDHALARRFAGFNLELFKNELKSGTCSKTRQRYTTKMKNFASTFYLYSPKAYAFLRKMLNLPNEANLRKIIAKAACTVQIKETSTPEKSEIN